MENIIIQATKSLTLTNKLPDGNINGDNISVGNDEFYTYSSFLFFDISSIPANSEISNAELVLFKTDNFYNNNRKCIYIYPLSDYFSSYTTYNNAPEVNKVIEGKLYPLTSKVSVTTNLTKIVSQWHRNPVLNKGIILCKRDNNFITNFGSAMCNDSYLKPFIKIVYSIKNVIVIHENHTKEKTICYPCLCTCPCTCKPHPTPLTPTIRKVQVTGIVAPYSIYLIIVTLSVTRIGTGHIDNYYVSDEYNNSAGVTPLAIDKFYNIAIIPQENPGDTEEIILSGSYKG